MKERIYISGPVTGIPNGNREAFESAAVALSEAGYNPLNPLDFTSPDMTWQQAMRRAIETMMKADGIATLDGCGESKGASVEIGLALDLGIPSKPLRKWL